MSGVNPNKDEGLSQEDIDAALSAAGPAGEQDAGTASAEPASVQPQDASASPDQSASAPVEMSQADVDAAGAAAGAAEAPPVEESVKVDSAGRPFDEMAAMMESAITEERAAAQADQGSAASAAGRAPALSVAAVGGPTESHPSPQAGATSLDLPDFSSPKRNAGGHDIELLNDVELNVKIELGRTEMLIADVLSLGEGSVVELDKLAGDPVDVLVNDRLVARGEVIVLNESFCVRVSEIMAGVSGEEATT
jgi:flagellar motor switch protein FliN/FliY